MLERNERNLRKIHSRGILSQDVQTCRRCRVFGADEQNQSIQITMSKSLSIYKRMRPHWKLSKLLSVLLLSNPSLSFFFSLLEAALCFFLFQTRRVLLSVGSQTDRPASSPSSLSWLGKVGRDSVFLFVCLFYIYKNIPLAAALMMSHKPGNNLKVWGLW